MSGFTTIDCTTDFAAGWTAIDCTGMPTFVNSITAGDDYIDVSPIPGIGDVTLSLDLDEIGSDMRKTTNVIFNNYTLTADDEVILIDSGGTSDITITLPEVTADLNGKCYYIKAIDNGRPDLKLQPNAADQVEQNGLGVLFNLDDIFASNSITYYAFTLLARSGRWSIISQYHDIPLIQDLNDVWEQDASVTSGNNMIVTGDVEIDFQDVPNNVIFLKGGATGGTPGTIGAAANNVQFYRIKNLQGVNVGFDTTNNELIFEPIAIGGSGNESVKFNLPVTFLDGQSIPADEAQQQLNSSTGNVEISQTLGSPSWDFKLPVFTTSSNPLSVETSATSFVHNGSSKDSAFSVCNSSGTKQTGLYKEFENQATWGNQIAYIKARGTESTPLIVQDGDSLARLEFFGYDGTANEFQRAADIVVQVDGTPGASDMPGRILFRTSQDGATSPTEALRISQDQDVKFFGTTTLGSGAITYTWPSADATASGYSLRSDGAGALSWANPNEIADDVSLCFGTDYEVSGVCFKWDSADDRLEVTGGSSGNDSIYFDDLDLEVEQGNDLVFINIGSSGDSGRARWAANGVYDIYATPIDPSTEVLNIVAPNPTGTSNVYIGATGLETDLDEITLAGKIVNFGSGFAGRDYQLVMNGQSNDGILTWKEDEDYFEFSDDLLISTTENIYFRDTGLRIHSPSDGTLLVESDGALQLGSTGETWNWPTADGSANHVMITNGAGVLSFVDVDTIVDQPTLATVLSNGNTSGGEDVVIDSGGVLQSDEYLNSSGSNHLAQWDNSNTLWEADERIKFTGGNNKQVTISELAEADIDSTGMFVIESEQDLGTTKPLLSLLAKVPQDSVQVVAGDFKVTRGNTEGAPALFATNIFQAEFEDTDATSAGAAYDAQIFDLTLTTPSSLSGNRQFRMFRCNKPTTFDDGGNNIFYYWSGVEVSFPSSSATGGPSVCEMKGFEVIGSANTVGSGSRPFNMYALNLEPNLLQSFGSYSGTFNSYGLRIAPSAAHGWITGTGTYNYAAIKIENSTLFTNTGTTNAYAINSAETMKSFLEGTLFIGSESGYTETFSEPGNDLGVEGFAEIQEGLTIGGDLNHDGTNVGFYGTAPAAQSAAYSPTNVSTDRAYDANATSTNELADVLGTLIADLQATGIIG